MVSVCGLMVFFLTIVIVIISNQRGRVSQGGVGELSLPYLLLLILI